MAQKKVVRISADKEREYLTSKGVSVRNASVDMVSSSLPESGRFIGRDVKENPFGGEPIIYVIAEDANGVEHKCALGRISVSGIKKVTKDQEISVKDIVLRDTKNGMQYMLNGRQLNPLVPNTQPEAIAFLVGKEFKSRTAETFTVPMRRNNQKYDSREQALEASQVKGYFELEIGADTAVDA